MRLGLRSIRRFTRVHPSGLPLARSPRMERERLRLLPRASHPTVTHDARQGGDDPFDTGPGHTLIKSSLQSVSPLTACDISRRTVAFPVANPGAFEYDRGAGVDQFARVDVARLTQVCASAAPAQRSPGPQLAGQRPAQAALPAVVERLVDR